MTSCLKLRVGTCHSVIYVVKNILCGSMQGEPIVKISLKLSDEKD